jgi:hypothetical protein
MKRVKHKPGNRYFQHNLVQEERDTAVAYLCDISRFSVLVTTSVGRETWDGRCTS